MMVNVTCKRTGLEGIAVVNIDGSATISFENGSVKTATASTFKRWYKKSAVIDSSEFVAVEATDVEVQLEIQPEVEVAEVEVAEVEVAEVEVAEVEVTVEVAAPIAVESQIQAQLVVAPVVVTEVPINLTQPTEVIISLVGTETHVTKKEIVHVIQRVQFGENIIELQSQQGFIHVVKLVDREGNLIHRSNKASLKDLFATYFGYDEATSKAYRKEITKVRKQAEKTVH